MRISNLQFAKGSIIYARFPQEMDYLNGRPLVIVSDHIPVYDCVWVVKCGTRGKAGINISLFNYATKDFIGGQQVTTIYPYNIYTVKVSQIVSTIGILDRHIMKKVDEAIDFFMGRSDEVPEFLRPFESELTDVTYQPALQPYTRINEGIGPEYEYMHNSTIFPVQTNVGDNTWNIPSEIPKETPPPRMRVWRSNPESKIRFYKISSEKRETSCTNSYRGQGSRVLDIAVQTRNGVSDICAYSN